MFLAKGIFRNCELDKYEEGCLPNTGYNIEWDVSFQCKTMEELLKEIKDYHDADDDAIQIESGKIYVQLHKVQLYDRWVIPTKKHMEDWKKGNQEIYLVDYSYQLYKEI